MDVLTDYVLDTHWLACWDCENPTVWRLCPWKKWPPVSGSGEPSHLSTPGHDLHMFTLNIYMYYYQNIHCNLTLKNNLNLLKLKLSPLPNMHEHPLNLHKRKAYEYNINTFYQITNTNFHHICISTGNVSSWGRQILKELFWRGFSCIMQWCIKLSRDYFPLACETCNLVTSFSIKQDGSSIPWCCDDLIPLHHPISCHHHPCVSGQLHRRCSQCGCLPGLFHTLS